MLKMSKEEVMQFLPHRDPFLFVDSLETIILPESTLQHAAPYTHQELVGAKTVCKFKVDQSVKVLEGHFPGNPILPGVVQVEMMAQAASFMAILTFDKPFHHYKIDVALLSVDSARFRKPVIPPMDLTIESKLMKVRGPMWMYDCQIFSNGDLVSQCNVMASIKIDAV